MQVKEWKPYVPVSYLDVSRVFFIFLVTDVSRFLNVQEKGKNT